MVANRPGCTEAVAVSVGPVSTVLVVAAANRLMGIADSSNPQTKRTTAGGARCQPFSFCLVGS
jgi:hypothetical protein